MFSEVDVSIHSNALYSRNVKKCNINKYVHKYVLFLLEYQNYPALVSHTNLCLEC